MALELKARLMEEEAGCALCEYDQNRRMRARASKLGRLDLRACVALSLVCQTGRHHGMGGRRRRME